MKKLLLTLLLLLSLGFAASAADYSDELTNGNFTGMSYTVSKTYTATNGSGAAYLAQASSNSGFQMRTSKAGTGVKNTTAPEGYIIESVEITFGRAGGGVNIYAADSDIDLKSLPATVTKATTTDDVIYVNAPYFAITPTNDTYCIVSKVVVNWVSTSGVRACATPVFSVEDGVELFAGQTITVNKGNADACELLVNGEPVEGLEYTIPETAEIGSTITLTANSTLEGGDPAEASASINVTVVEAPLVAEFNFSTFGWSNQQEISTVNMGLVTLNFDKKSNSNAPKYFTNNNDVRLYGGGALTISIDQAYYITKIESVYSNTQNTLSADCGSFNSDYTTWTNVANDVECYESAVTFTESGTSGNRSWKSIVVSYAKRPEPETELVGFTHEESFGRTVVRVEYMLHLNNHKDANEYTVELTVGGMTFSNTEHSDASIVEEAANAPMRALNPDDVASETTLKGTILATGLEAEKEYGTASVAVKLGDKEIHNATIENFTTGTTGIEDVTVEDEAAAEYFNLQGVRVAEPQAGQIYIVRRGAKAVKELVK